MEANQAYDQDQPSFHESKSLDVEGQTQTQHELKVDELDYTKRGQWLRAAILGANDGLLSTASLMMGVGAVRKDVKTMILSGVAGLVAGACSMAIGELVSVYSQYDIEIAQMKRKLKYTPSSPYENNVNSLLTSLVNSAMSTTYNNFTVPGIASPQDTLYGLFQCRGDLMGNDCARCVALAVSQLGTLCVDSFGGALQLEGCFVKYDNTSFLGVEDKTEVVKKCGPSIRV
uniref:Vacuolar iron transporter n=1 Tax=Fagus sylvatica TaxID=28930 RepID=A0A2N9HXD2_FAGSY